MEHLGLLWVLLAGTLAGTLATSSTRVQDLGTIDEVAMDMAQNCFDDQYQNCTFKTTKELLKRSLTEFNKKIYIQTLKTLLKKWRKILGKSSHREGLQRKQALALMAYTAGKEVQAQFNAAVREGGQSHNYYLQSFHFKTLHFLLTKAVQKLREVQGQKCHNVYRGVTGTRFTAQLEQTVRFGQFATTSLNEMAAQKFGRDTFFSVHTCYGVLIRNFSFYPNEDEVLIPPYEVFMVTTFTRYKEGTFIQLQSIGLRSTYNCALLNGRHSQQGGCHQEMGLGLGHSPGQAPRSPRSSSHGRRAVGPRATGSVRGRGALW
ncbi:NAD(P)(+)--arginine ADP-ribosyltransferase 2-like [Oxyura jamaicensis]|uniref:NAD(P)(+)--arginine ADP-ribosyltransferase 2-like n=1 Tax=Oxyura jamaicensis TaxID=8884 RepID=UPI0015A57EBC|nr:NAD(P)(+)--arginine ADP-ribosyltransferase 2-like [Oxyura jamaicensis]